MPKIKLESSDHEIFNVDVKVAECSNTIKTMLDDLGLTKEEEDEPIPLPNLPGVILRKVLEWCNYHKDDPPMVEDDKAERRSDDICDWDRDFLRVDQSTVFDLILAANYLDIKGLLDAASKTIANMMVGKSPEEIRKLFNIKNDFTPTEEEQIRKENAWCEEK